MTVLDNYVRYQHILQAILITEDSGYFHLPVETGSIKIGKIKTKNNPCNLTQPLCVLACQSIKYLLELQAAKIITFRF